MSTPAPEPHPETVLVTGGYGCIGAETTKYLLRNTDVFVVICSRRVSQQRTDDVFSDLPDEMRQRLTTCELDIRDQRATEGLLREHSVSRVIHLAALQTPDCNANRDLGLQINLAGTQNLLEAIKVARLDEKDSFRRFVFASSVAVYGFRQHYPPGPVAMDASPRPVNPYGIWKLAGEELTRQFFEETGIPSVSLRPGVLFGPGRDIGLTSAPTTAMKHLARGEAYQVPFRSKQDYLYAPDVGAAFGIAAMQTFDGYGFYTLPSHTTDTVGFVELMRDCAAELEPNWPFNITVGEEDVPFICDLEFTAFTERFSQVPHTALRTAILQSLRIFRDKGET